MLWWTSTDAIKALAGEDYERTRSYTEDNRYLLAWHDTIEHSNVVIDGLLASSRMTRASVADVTSRAR